MYQLLRKLDVAETRKWTAVVFKFIRNAKTIRDFILFIYFFIYKCLNLIHRMHLLRTLTLKGPLSGADLGIVRPPGHIRPFGWLWPARICVHTKRDTTQYKVNVETRIGRNLLIEKPVARFDWRRDIFPCHRWARSCGLQRNIFRWSLNIWTLPRHSLGDSQSAFTPWVK